MPIDYKIHGIYFIKNIVTNKYYVGSSLNIQKRFYQYLFLLKRGRCHSPKLQNSFNKHGETSFEFGLVESCEKDELRMKERYWIDFYNSVNNGYNCSNDTNCSTRGRKMTQKQKEVISKRNKERWEKDDGCMLAISRANIKKATEKRTGNKNSDAHNTAISKANSGKIANPKTILKMKEYRLNNPTNYWLGKKRSKQDREKMRLSHLGKTGELHPRSKKIAEYDLDGNKLGIYFGAYEAARITGGSRKGINNCLLGYTKKSNNKIWKYAAV